MNKLLYTYSNAFTDQNNPVIRIIANYYYNSKLQYHRSRPIPYAMTQRIDNEIDRLWEEDIIEPIEISD